MRASRVWWAFGCLLALAGGIAAAVWQAPRTIDLSDVPTLHDGEGAPARREPERPAEPAPPALAQDAPPGVTAAQWARLRAEFARQPEELRRLADHFAYAENLRRFRAAQGAERRALAEALDAGLDARLRQREMTAAEARLLKVALLDTLVPDDAATRSAALERWQAQWVPQADAARQAREHAFQTRQAAVVAAWMARPAGQRDRQALEHELEALRREAFAAR
jgi:hypothetical protein